VLHVPRFAELRGETGSQRPLISQQDENSYLDCLQWLFPKILYHSAIVPLEPDYINCDSDSRLRYVNEAEIFSHTCVQFYSPTILESALKDKPS
jgi:hypothetical protein